MADGAYTVAVSRFLPVACDLSPHPHIDECTPQNRASIAPRLAAEQQVHCREGQCPRSDEPCDSRDQQVNKDAAQEEEGLAGAEHDDAARVAGVFLTALPL